MLSKGGSYMVQVNKGVSCNSQSTKFILRVVVHLVSHLYTSSTRSLLLRAHLEILNDISSMKFSCC